MDVSLRGFQVSPVIGVPQGVTVYVDGVRATSPTRTSELRSVALEDVDRVEVVYGPSVLLGRNALGGLGEPRDAPGCEARRRVNSKPPRGAGAATS